MSNQTETPDLHNALTRLEDAIRAEVAAYAAAIDERDTLLAKNAAEIKRLHAQLAAANTNIAEQKRRIRELEPALAAPRKAKA